MAAKLFTLLHVFRYPDRIETNTVYAAGNSSAEVEANWRDWLCHGPPAADRIEAYIATDQAADISGPITIAGTNRQSTPVDEFHRWETTACEADWYGGPPAWRYVQFVRKHPQPGPHQLSYRDLPEIEQGRARAMFLGAGLEDGFVYELDLEGVVISRRKHAA